MDYSIFNKLFLENNYYMIIKAYYFKVWKKYNMKLHKHNQVEIMYITEGECTVYTNIKEYNLKKNQYILIDANIEHALTVQRGKTCRILNVEFIFDMDSFSTPSIGDLYRNIPSFSNFIDSHKKVIKLKDSNRTYQLLKYLILELDKDDDNNLSSQLIISQLLIEITNNALESSRRNINSNSTYVKSAVEYLHHNYDCDIKILDIADSININKNYLQKIFKKQTNLTIIDYLTNIRIEKAKMFLVQTDIPIIDISSYVGLNSRQYFTYLFKKYVGISPKEYRKMKSYVFNQTHYEEVQNIKQIQKN